MRLGIDFGGVIVKAAGRGQRDTALAGREDSQVAQPGVFEAVKQLVAHCNGQVWIVSKAGAAMQARSLAWLESVDFYAQTGLLPNQVLFCLERQDKEPICRELGITHFIDDRVHVMQILRHTVPNLYLFADLDFKLQCPAYVKPVTSWRDVIEAIISRSQ